LKQLVDKVVIGLVLIVGDFIGTVFKEISVYAVFNSLFGNHCFIASGRAVDHYEPLTVRVGQHFNDALDFEVPSNQPGTIENDRGSNGVVLFVELN
jgi:hypothetical protein